MQFRNQADISVRFVQQGEDARVQFRRNGARAQGVWHVVGKFENPDIKVFIDPFGRDGTVDVRVVDARPGCN